jgi:porin
MSTWRHVVLIALCPLWISATGVSADGPNPPASNIELPNAGMEGASGSHVTGDSAGGEEGEPGASTVSTIPQPPPFGGPCDSRPKLTGDWCCRREYLRDSGYTFDISTTEYYQGVATGGLQEKFRFGGRNDYLINVDGEKAGLWQGLYINLHGETVYGDSVNLMTGAVVPVNIGRAHPAFIGTDTALTAVRFTQALSENLVVYGGKINTIDNIQQPFMRGRGLDAGFMNAAFVWNPILGRTMNYATLGAGAAVLVDGQPVATLTVYDTHDDTNTSGFDVLFNNGAVIFPQVILPTNFFGMAGHQSIWAAYSSGQYGILDPQSINIFPPPTPGPPPTIPVRGSWWTTYLFDQALWVDSTDPTRSWGVFGNGGISGGDPNPIKWSLILGIGGSSPLQDRPLDSFGLAYYYLSISDNLKDLVRPVLPLRDERGVELFYKVGVTPWMQVTADMQVITPILEPAETSLVLGARVRIDF